MPLLHGRGTELIYSAVLNGVVFRLRELRQKRKELQNIILDKTNQITGGFRKQK